MCSNSQSVEQRLFDLLGSAAMYNDKGVVWGRHTAEKTAEMQLDFLVTHLAPAEEIGASRLGNELLSAIGPIESVQHSGWGAAAR